MSHVFLSYASTDAAFVERLARSLEAHGFEAWVDRHDIAGGEVWRGRIVEAICDAVAVVLVLSENSIVSRNVRKEMDIAEEAGKSILPVQVGQVRIPKELSYQLAGLQRLTVRADLTEGVPELVRALTVLTGESKNAEKADISDRTSRLHLSPAVEAGFSENTLQHAFAKTWYRSGESVIAAALPIAYEAVGRLEIHNHGLRFVSMSSTIEISFADINSVTRERIGGDLVNRWCVVRYGRPERRAGFKDGTLFGWRGDTAALQASVESALTAFRSGR